MEAGNGFVVCEYTEIGEMVTSWLYATGAEGGNQCNDFTHPQPDINHSVLQVPELTACTRLLTIVV